MDKSNAEEVSFLKVLNWSEDQCRAFLANARWSERPRCPKCGAGEPYTISRKTTTKNRVASLYKCRACKRQFSATTGTIFEDSKLPLSKWFGALFLMCGSKKGISAHQIHRELDVTYKTAWFMCHRVREAMREKNLTPMTGVEEADETYIGPKTRRGHPADHAMRKWEERVGLRKPSPKSHWTDTRATVFGMLERGGRARTLHVPDATRLSLRPLILKNIDAKTARLITDRRPAYRPVVLKGRHYTINHELAYVDGEVHIQAIENYWSLLKRGIVGVFHHVDARNLRQYLDEFEFRFNRRRISDAERFAALKQQVRGRLLWYCRTPQPENPHA